jgi:phosphate starvation-inducible PhoH-like protein
MFERQMIEIAPLAYMRGRTLNHAFIILDEAQNTTPEQMKMFLTRIGFGSKAVVTGDTSQVDLPRGHKSGLVEAQQVLGDVRGIALTLHERGRRAPSARRAHRRGVRRLPRATQGRMRTPDDA